MMSPRLTDDVTFRLPLTTVGKGQRIAETIKQLKSIICSHLYKRKLKSYTHRLSWRPIFHISLIKFVNWIKTILARTKNNKTKVSRKPNVFIIKITLTTRYRLGPIALVACHSLWTNQLVVWLTCDFNNRTLKSALPR